jgi:2-dehydropantoate 2-reductase
MSQSVLIIGSGALACLFAARLKRAGQSVVMTGTWEAGLNSIRRNGVGLVTGEKMEYFPVDVLDMEAQPVQFDRAIILTKAYQTSAALNRVKPWLSDSAVVLSLQNGLTPRMRLIEILGEARVISGTTTCAAEQIAPGVVNHHGGETISIGAHTEANGYREMFIDCGFEVSIIDDIKRMIWEKAVINSAANPVGAIMRMRNGEMAALPDVLALMDALIAEACAVAVADGCRINKAGMRQRLRTILDASASNRCSMLQDVMHGRETEINDINGAILELAEKFGIQTPVQRTVTQLVRSIKREEY